ncbi:hypothetical protein [Achromobacter sp.]|uniref:hypothetical protein n=1 Tax=Achromobacter sp. TaxID=134375 RepID=UPI0028AB729B|nr:hypothetical protein [Achromobacter sp.]
MHHAFPVEQLTALAYVDRDANQVRSRVLRIVNDLASVFSLAEVEERVGLVITSRDSSGFAEQGVDNSDVYATLNCPLGSGRLTLGWATRQLNGGGWELLGVLATEKLVRNPKDELEWAKVWAINVPKGYDDPWMGSGDQVSYLRYSKQLGQEKTDSLYFAGLAMVYSIGVGKLR